MKMIVGLGNPGAEYVGTRHNAGFFVAEKLQKLKLPKDVVVQKSDVFMNDSGSFIQKLLSKYPSIPISRLYIVHDDLDIPIGSYKIQFGRGPKDHNGLKSIDDRLGTSTYWHVRVGINNRPPDYHPLGEEYVLQNFSNDERRILEKAVKGLCKKLVTLLANTN